MYPSWVLVGSSVVEGRNPDPTHPWGCEYIQLIRIAGDRRQNPAVAVRRPGRTEHEAIHATSSSCNYWESKHRSRAAAFVAAPADAYLNGTEAIRNFDVVVVDEAIVPFLLGSLTVTLDHVAEWRERMAEINTADVAAGNPPRYGLQDPLGRFVAALELVLHRLPSERDHDWPRALPALRKICPDLPALLAELADSEPPDPDGRYPRETPRLGGTDRIVPLRLVRELAQTLGAEANRPVGPADGAARDPRLGLSGRTR